MANRIGIVMAGGSGERFWPLSRPGRPKQLLRLTHPEMTMLEEAVDRLLPLLGSNGIYVATSMPLRQPIIDSKVLPEDHILSEPARRNTLGAQVWIVANLIALGLQDSTLAILTSDHLIGEPDNFRACLSAAMETAEQEGGIATLGIVPTRPETGYGYIEEDTHHPENDHGGRVSRKTKSFREKPSAETAESFLESGNFLWNSGMFFYTIDSFLSELSHTQPEAHRICLAVAKAIADGNTSEAVAEFERLPNISIDYAVMEKSKNVSVLRADFPWDDVGAWDAVERTRPKDEAGNVIEGLIFQAECKDCIVLNMHGDLKIGLLGLEDMVVVASEEALLVCHKSDVQRVRLIAQMEGV